ncbi:MAG: endonuclease/exonuclease/phosphatase family protein [Saprospiraceae bacterium]|nr:endonuclease/exonuclease/phosphatase family protein [Saprospiraceae bacterium]
MNHLLRYAGQILSAGVVLLTVLSYVSPKINPSSFSWLAFFGTAYPWLLIFNVVLMLIWAWRMNRFALYHLGIILFGWQYFTGFFGIDFGKDKIPESAITVATHNLGGIYLGKNPTDDWRDKRVAAYAQFLQENGFPDILCTQETSGKFYRALADKLGYRHTFNLKKGTVILSRFPIEAGGEVPFEKTSNSILWADIRISKNRLVRVYNVHLQSNRVTQTTRKVLEKGDLDEGETWQDIGFVLDRVGNATALRAEQAQKLRQHIDACKSPVILCGDFNDTPNSYVYQLLAKGFTDTFQEKGLGPGTTFAGALPLLRIDYVLTEKSITSFSCKVERSPVFSDHYPVFTSLGF